MESYIKLSTLNDFDFCERSIFYHELYDNYNEKMYHSKAQTEWKLLHKSIDKKTYSTSKHMLQSLEVYSDYYGIAWKIDTFDIKKWELVERKKQIFLDENKKPKIYRWKRYQLWGQMFCLEEMWYEVNSLWIYSIKDNKKYRIYKPSAKEIVEFEGVLEKYRKFDLLQKNWKQNTNKCMKCIYKELCDYYIWEVYPQLELFPKK